mmetsp:Transcript_5286/g.11499  ORF Transcript_5286/g.11499 Transcript_5286/m.11499 type:complete len:408 (+) Transcript_5286:175-1398(+)
MTAPSVINALSLLFFIHTASSFSGAASSPSSASGPIRRVVVVGGTHGNEYTGVWCIKALDHTPPTEYPSLDISTLLGNPQAHYANKRFIHTDLNREFSAEKLTNNDPSAECEQAATGTLDDECLLGSEGLPLTVEALRAKELNAMLGPKFGDEHPATDLVVDLHSTTSNMGTTIIIPEGDVIMARAAAYVLHECGGEEGETRILMHSIPKREHRPNLSSAARHGFTIEVGPVPQGVLRHDAVENTQRALAALFNFLQKFNDDEDAVKAELDEIFPSGHVPCFRSALAKLPGQMSGKIIWPSDPDNPNFPGVLVHKSLQDQDFIRIRKGDPLFVDLGGGIIPYDGSHGDEVHLIFVNEGGYYYQSSGTGIGVAVASEYDLNTARLPLRNDEFAGGVPGSSERVASENE